MLRRGAGRGRRTYAPRWVRFKRAGDELPSHFSLAALSAPAAAPSSQLPLLPELLLLHTDSAFVDAVWRGGHEYSVRRRDAVSGADVEVYKAAMQQPGAATGALNYYRAAMLSVLGLVPKHQEVRQHDRAVTRGWGEAPLRMYGGQESDGAVAGRVRTRVDPAAAPLDRGLLCSKFFTKVED
jgi:hypothetical protein